MLDRPADRAGAGLSDLDCARWSAFVFPKGTPDAIVRRLAKATNEAVETPAVRERLESIGVTIPAPERRTPEYFVKFVAERDRARAGADQGGRASAD